MTDSAKPGDSLLRLHGSPVVVAVTAFVGLVVLWNSGRTVFADDAGSRPWLNWVALASMLYGVIAQLVLVPRLLEPQTLRREADAERGRLVVASIRLAFAVTPSVVGFALVGAGAERWVSTAALAVSALLLIPYVRAASDSHRRRP